MKPESFSRHFSFRTRLMIALGLSLSRQLIKLHGGYIRAESEGPGKGSRFVIELPCRPMWIEK
ncbi:MAG: hypothetical protein NTU74_19265 [Deltaproteobacteria bacterium]|nr:hypothetical protein [Deltaproteobacteria bacterium]